MNGEQIRVLVIDDEAVHAEAVAESLERVGYECVIATSGSAGARKIERGRLRRHPHRPADGRHGRPGHPAQGQARRCPTPRSWSSPATATCKTAVEAIKQGAANYLTKPVDLAELRAIVDKAAERLRLARANRELKRQLDEKFGFEGVVGNSPQMHEVIDQAAGASPRPAPPC